MKELTLQEIKKVEFELLMVFDSFCKKNNIRYFLSNGTLLGAVKYNGFIPWDDDVDVLVPREDYDRLIALFSDNEQYQLFSFERNNQYRYPFAKLCDMSTRKLEANICNGVALGVDIDVFPLDGWNENLLIAKKEVRYINRNMFLLGLTKIENADSINPVKRLVKSIAMCFCKMRGSAHYVKKIIQASQNNICQGNQFVGCKAWCIYGEREIIPSSVFESAIDVKFEGATFPAPQGYNDYLNSLYGDYEQDPPFDKQKTHHNFKAYRL